MRRTFPLPLPVRLLTMAVAARYLSHSRAPGTRELDPPCQAVAAHPDVRFRLTRTAPRTDSGVGAVVRTQRASA
ncbi:hypothetical protein ACTU45_27290, partial [Streptomyces sp. 24-1644]